MHNVATIEAEQTMVADQTLRPIEDIIAEKNQLATYLASLQARSGGRVSALID